MSSFFLSSYHHLIPSSHWIDLSLSALSVPQACRRNLPVPEIHFPWPLVTWLVMSNPHWRQPVMFQDRMRASIPAFPSRVSEPSLLFICRIVVGRCRRLRSGPADVLLGSSAVSWRKERGRFFADRQTVRKREVEDPGIGRGVVICISRHDRILLSFFFSRAKMKRWMIWVNAFI